MKHVWIPRDSSAEVCDSGSLPLFVEGLAVDVAQAHGGHAAGDDVEAGGNACGSPLACVVVDGTKNNKNVKAGTAFQKGGDLQMISKS